jgi:hypothetical protein
MTLLPGILAPLAVLLILAVAFALRRRRRGAPSRGHDASPAARKARASADARGASGTGPPPGATPPSGGMAGF